MQEAFFEWKKRKSQGDSTQYPAETLLSSLTSLQKKSEDRRGICRTSCATSIPHRRRGQSRHNEIDRKVVGEVEIL